MNQEIVDILQAQVFEGKDLTKLPPDLLEWLVEEVESLKPLQMELQRQQKQLEEKNTLIKLLITRAKKHLEVSEDVSAE